MGIFPIMKSAMKINYLQKTHVQFQTSREVLGSRPRGVQDGIHQENQVKITQVLRTLSKRRDSRQSREDCPNLYRM